MSAEPSGLTFSAKQLAKIHSALGTADIGLKAVDQLLRYASLFPVSAQ